MEKCKTGSIHCRIPECPIQHTIHQIIFFIPNSQISNTNALIYPNQIPKNIEHKLYSHISPNKSINSLLLTFYTSMSSVTRHQFYSQAPMSSQIKHLK